MRAEPGDLSAPACRSSPGSGRVRSTRPPASGCRDRSGHSRRRRVVSPPAPRSRPRTPPLRGRAARGVTGRAGYVIPSCSNSARQRRPGQLRSLSVRMSPARRPDPLGSGPIAGEASHGVRERPRIPGGTSTASSPSVRARVRQGCRPSRAARRRREPGRPCSGSPVRPSVTSRRPRARNPQSGAPRQPFVLDPRSVRDVGRRMCERCSSWPLPMIRNGNLGNQACCGEDRVEPVERDQLADEERVERLIGALARARTAAPRRRRGTHGRDREKGRTVRRRTLLGPPCPRRRGPPPSRRLCRSQAAPERRRMPRETARGRRRRCRRATPADRTRPAVRARRVAPRECRHGPDSRRERRRPDPGARAEERAEPPRGRVVAASRLPPPMHGAVLPRPLHVTPSPSIPAARRHERTCALRG